jgi:hypothetical protein
MRLAARIVRQTSLAVLLLLQLIGHAIAQQDNDQGAWRLEVQGRSCSLAVAGVGNSIALLSVPEWFLVLVKLSTQPSHEGHTGAGTLSVGSNRDQITLRFTALDPQMSRDRNLMAVVPRKEWSS